MGVTIVADRGGCTMICNICNAQRDCESISFRERTAWINKHDKECRQKRILKEVDLLMAEYKRLDRKK